MKNFLLDSVANLISMYAILPCQLNKGMITQIKSPTIICVIGFKNLCNQCNHYFVDKALYSRFKASLTPRGAVLGLPR